MPAEENESEELEEELQSIIKEDEPSGMSIDELQKQLDLALEREEYEKASRLRDEINKRKGA